MIEKRPTTPLRYRIARYLFAGVIMALATPGMAEPASDATAEPEPANLPAERSDSGMAPLWVLSGALALVGGAIVWFRGQRRPGWLGSDSRAAVRIVGRVPLGPGTQVALLDIGDERLVIGVSPQQVSLLRALPPVASPAQDPAAEPGATALQTPRENSAAWSDGFRPSITRRAQGTPAPWRRSLTDLWRRRT